MPSVLFALSKSGRCAIALLATLITTCPLAAQAQQGPQFFDQRRLPDLELERRNQEILQEQRRVQDVEAKRKAEEQRLAAEAEQQKQAAEAYAKRRAEQQRLAAEALAKRKAEEQRLAAEAEAQGKQKADEQKLATEAEAKRKAEEQKLAAEAEAKRKAEQQKLAAEAEAKRKAEEQKLAADAEAKKKAEELKLAAEAEAKRKSDELKLAAEAEAKRKAEQAQAANRRDAAPATVAALSPALVSGPCEPAKVIAEPLIGGRVQLKVDSACRRGQNITLLYGDHDMVRKLDGNGQAIVIVDLIFGTGDGLTVKTADGRQDRVALVAKDAGQYSKAAVIWRKAVDLNLHASEGNAAFGTPGHVWSKAPLTAEEAKEKVATSGRGAGFMSTIDDGNHDGSKVEVYTFFHSPEQPSGAVPFSVDHTSRGAQPAGEMCGTGALAEVPFDAVLLLRTGEVQRDSGVIPSVACGTPLEGKTRYLKNAVPDLRFRR